MSTAERRGDVPSGTPKRVRSRQVIASSAVTTGSSQPGRVTVPAPCSQGDPQLLPHQILHLVDRVEATGDGPGEGAVGGEEEEGGVAPDPQVGRLQVAAGVGDEGVGDAELL